MPCIESDPFNLSSPRRKVKNRQESGEEKAALGHGGPRRERVAPRTKQAFHGFRTPSPPGTQAEPDTSCAQRLEVSARIRSTGGHSYSATLDVRPKADDTFALREKGPKKMIHRQYKCQALTQYCRLLLAKLMDGTDDTHCRKAASLPGSGLAEAPQLLTHA